MNKFGLGINLKWRVAECSPSIASKMLVPGPLSHEDCHSEQKFDNHKKNLYIVKRIMDSSYPRNW